MERITLIGYERGTDSFGSFEHHIFAVGRRFGKRVLIREELAEGQGRSFHSFSTQLEGSCCWIGQFRSSRQAYQFYLPCPLA